MKSVDAEYLESIGFARVNTAEDDDEAWALDVPGGFRELRTNGREWWPAMLGDYGTHFEDDWVGESVDSPVAAFAQGELADWGDAR